MLIDGLLHLVRLEFSQYDSIRCTAGPTATLILSGPWRDTEVRRAFACARQLLYVLRSLTRGPAYVYNIQG